MSERDNVTSLLRWVGGFVAWPALSISLVFMLDFEDHILHVAGLFPLGIAGLIVFFMAPKLAAKWVPEEA